MTRIRVHVCGAGGRMGGAAVAAIRAASDLELGGSSGRGDDLPALLAANAAEVAVEFTTPQAVAANVRTMLECGVHVVCGTTGLARETVVLLGQLAAARGLGLVLAPNFALGAALLQRSARQAARHFAAVEIVELHHDGKRDAPSGTAIETARQIAAAALVPASAPAPASAPGRGAIVHGVPIHSVRLPGLVAHQEVLFGGCGELLTLRHDALDRSAFVPGILMAIRRVRSRRGLVDSLEALLDS